MTMMKKMAVNMGKDRKHVTWADLVVWMTGVLAAVAPEAVKIGAESWGALLSPAHIFHLIIPAAAVTGVWARKFTKE